MHDNLHYCFMSSILKFILFPPRLGWLIRFISHSVISGFTIASAIVIALSQAKYFLRYDVERSSKIVPLVKSIIEGADGVCYICWNRIFLVQYIILVRTWNCSISKRKFLVNPCLFHCCFHLLIHFSNL